MSSGYGFDSCISSLLISFGNTSEAFLTVFLFENFFREDNLFNKNGILKLFFSASFGCLVAALIGPLALISFLDVSQFKFYPLVWTWLLGDLTGIIVCTPILMYLKNKDFSDISRYPVKFSSFFISFNIFCYTFLASGYFSDFQEGVLAYIFLPFVIWGVYRFELGGALTIILISYIHSVFATISGSGLFYLKGDINSSLLSLNLFIIIICLSTLTMALLYSHLNRLKQIMIQAGKLAEIGEMSSSLIHELRNPLTVLVQGTEILNKKIQLDKLDEPELVEKNLKNMMNSSDKMKKIIKNVGDFSRFSNFSKETIAMNEIVKESYSICSEEIEKNYINLVLNLSNEELYVNADPLSIEQVIVNILNNAKDAILSNDKDKKREIVIETKKENTNAVLLIKDTGAGMSEIQKESVFTPFYITKDKGKGTGLGLSISYNIIKDHKGFISILDSDNKGSCFKIELPLRS